MIMRGQEALRSLAELGCGVELLVGIRGRGGRGQCIWIQGHAVKWDLLFNIPDCCRPATQVTDRGARQHSA